MSDSGVIVYVDAGIAALTCMLKIGEFELNYEVVSPDPFPQNSATTESFWISELSMANSQREWRILKNTFEVTLDSAYCMEFCVLVVEPSLVEKIIWWQTCMKVHM